VPTLAYLHTANTSETYVKRTTDGVTGAAWAGSGATLIETNASAPDSYGQSIVFKDSIFWAHFNFTGGAGTGAITQYDLLTTTLTRYNVGSLLHTGQKACAYVFHVHDNVLFLFGWAGGTQFGRVTKLQGGVFTTVYTDASQAYQDLNIFGHSAMFTDIASGDLVLIMAERNNAGTARAKVVSFADATGAATPTDRSTTVMGAVEGADKYLEGGIAANTDRRWSVFVDTETAPATPRTFLTTWIPGGSTETWEWKGLSAEMELVGAGAGVSDDFALPYNTVGGGHRSPRASAVELSGTALEVIGGTQVTFQGHGLSSAGTLTFRGTDTQGSPSTVVPIVGGSLTIGKGFLTDLSIYWKFNSTVVGETVAANVLTLTAVGSVPYAAALIGNGLDFPGTTGNFFTHVAVDALKIGKNSEPFTISCWVNFDSLAGGAVLVSQSNDTTNGFVLEVLADGTVQHRWPVNLTVSTAPGLVDTVSGWQHVVSTSDGGVLKIYVDNVLAQTGGTWPTQNSTTVFSVGATAAGTSKNIDGKMDELAIWSRVVDVNEVDYLYNSQSGFELDAITPFAVTPAISGNTITNFLPDGGATPYTVILDIDAAGVDIDEGETGLIIPGLV
jgi:hypothetical protein